MLTPGSRQIGQFANWYLARDALTIENPHGTQCPA